MTYDKKLNYCTFSPDRLFGVTFNYACYLHDRQYRNEVKNRKTKKQADIDLGIGITRIFINKNKKKLGYFIGHCYYWGSRILGIVFGRWLWRQ